MLPSRWINIRWTIESIFKSIETQENFGRYFALLEKGLMNYIQSAIFIETSSLKISFWISSLYQWSWLTLTDLITSKWSQVVFNKVLKVIVQRVIPRQLGARRGTSTHMLASSWRVTWRPMSTSVWTMQGQLSERPRSTSGRMMCAPN